MRRVRPEGGAGGNVGKRVSSRYNRRRRIATGRSGKQQAGRTAVRTAPIVCPEESPLVRPQAHTPCSARRVRPEGGAGGRAESHPACSNRRQLCRKNSPWRGLTRRLRRGRRTCSPIGRSIVSVGDPKGCRGERREAGIQWIQPPKAVSAPEFRQTTSGTHGSANRADCLPRGKPPACIDKRQLCREKFPFGGA